MEIDPNSTLVNYEIAMTYMYAKDFENSLKHRDKVIKAGKSQDVLTYIIKG